MLGGNSSNKTWQEQIDRLVSEMPADYPQAAVWAAQITQAFRDRMAEVLQPRLKSHLTSMPADSLEEKRNLATWVNGELHKLGMTIRCPKTGRPAVLYADFQDAEHETVTRFRTTTSSADSRGSRRTTVSQDLPTLDIMPTPVRPERFSRGYSR